MKKDTSPQTMTLEAETCDSRASRRISREVSLECILERIDGSGEARDLLRRLKPFMGHAPNFTALHATHIATSAFSVFASDEVNVGKLTSSLDAAVTELQTLSFLLKGLLD